MKTLTPSFVKNTAAQLRLSKSLQKQLNLSLLTTTPQERWQNDELYSLPTKNNAAGILFVTIHDTIYATAYEIGPLPAQATGRAKPIICDFCKTWQAGGRAGSITFRTDRRSAHSISFLCCLDLACSLHVRDLTEASKASRAQLREDITQEYRVLRLQKRLLQLTEQLHLRPLEP